MYLGQGGNSDLFWLPLKAFDSVEELISVEDASLRCASLRSGEGDKYHHML